MGACERGVKHWLFIFLCELGSLEKKKSERSEDEKIEVQKVVRGLQGGSRRRGHRPYVFFLPLAIALEKGRQGWECYCISNYFFLQLSYRQASSNVFFFVSEWHCLLCSASRSTYANESCPTSIIIVVQRRRGAFSNAMLLLWLLCVVSSQFYLVIGSSKSELLFPYGAEFNDQNLVNETDDFSSVEVELTTPVVFYEQSYFSIYVSFA